MTRRLGFASNFLIGLGCLILLAGPARAQSGGVDTTFAPGGGSRAGLDGDVFTITVQPDGRLLITGFFSTMGSMSRSGIARLNSDGSLDAGFDPGAGAFDTVLNQHALVEAQVLQRDGRVVVVGRFDLFDNVSRKYIARLDS